MSINDSHFQVRWRERGLKNHNAFRVQMDIVKDWSAGLLDVVIWQDGVPIVRFVVDGCPFYAPMSPDGFPFTVLTGEMVRRIKRRRKRVRRRPFKGAHKRYKSPNQ